MIKTAIFFFFSFLLIGCQSGSVQPSPSDTTATEKAAEQRIILRLDVADFICRSSSGCADATFRQAMTAAQERQTAGDAGFVGLLVQEYEKRHGDPLGLEPFFRQSPLLRHLSVDKPPANSVLLQVLEAETEAAMQQTLSILQIRLQNFGIAAQAASLDAASGQIILSIPSSVHFDLAFLISRANLEFRPAIPAAQLAPALAAADQALTGKAEGGLFQYLQPNSTAAAFVGAAYPKDTALIRRMLADKAAQTHVSGIRFFWSAHVLNATSGNIALYAAADSPASLRSEHLTAAVPVTAPDGSFAIQLTMNEAGTNAWKTMTQAAIGKHILMAFDDKVFSAPMVQEAIASSVTQISGNFTGKEAADFAALLQSGALPMAVSIDTKPL